MRAKDAACELEPPFHGEAPSFFDSSHLSGEQGIRTLGTVAGTLDFESSAFDHSASSPPPFIASSEMESTGAPCAQEGRIRMQLGPPLEEDEGFMRLALEEAMRAASKGEVPVGCVIVHRGQAIARAHNLREASQDPTAHAEILAIRQAAQAIGSWRLCECTAYVTLEPCPMCAGALVNSRIGRLVFGAEDPKGGAVLSLFRIGSDLRLNHRFALTPYVLREEASLLLKSFFAEIRRNRRALRLEKEASQCQREEGSEH